MVKQTIEVDIQPFALSAAGRSEIVIRLEGFNGQIKLYEHMKIGVLLSGCGVYDGAEIQESVLTLLSIEEIYATAVCISVDKNQHHVVNHATGEEMEETRNMLTESARIARGDIHDIKNIHPADIDALVIPGGFGNAKT